MTYKEAYTLINPKKKTMKELVYWTDNYKNLYRSELMQYINAPSSFKEYHLGHIHKNHLGYTIFMLEKMRRDYCE